jgi:hypothetical protein
MKVIPSANERIRLYSMMTGKLERRFELSRLPQDVTVTDSDPLLISYMHDNEGCPIPIFVQGESDCVLLHGANLVNAARIAGIQSLPAIVFPADAELDDNLFTAKGRDGISLAERVILLQEILAGDDKSVAFAAAELGLSAKFVKGLMAYTTGHKDLVAAHMRGEIEEAILLASAGRPPAEQARLAQHLSEAGELYMADVQKAKEIVARHDLLVPYYVSPDYDGGDCVLSAQPTHKGARFQVVTDGGTRSFEVPVEKLLALAGE